MDPKVTVLIPARNERRVVAKAVRSMLDQTLRDIEVLLLDNGSTDGTGDVARRAAAGDPRLRVIDCAGAGLAEALNVGIDAAAAPYVARLDADDWSHPGRLARQHQVLEAEPTTAALGTFGWRTNQWRMPVARLRTGPASPQTFNEWRAQRAVVMLTSSSLTTRREIARAVGGFKQSYYPADDVRFINDLADHGDVYALPEPLTYYRLRPFSVSSVDAERMALQTTRVTLEVERGEPYASFESFLEATADNHERWIAEQRAFVIERRMARAIVNGRLGTIVGLLREHGPAALRLGNLNKVVQG